MSSSTLALMIFIAVVALMLVGIVYAIKDKKRTQRSGSYASLAAFHDMQPEDKQKAIETIIEKQAGKKWEEEESGEGENEHQR